LVFGRPAAESLAFGIHDENAGGLWVAGVLDARQHEGEIADWRILYPELGTTEHPAVIRRPSCRGDAAQVRAGLRLGQGKSAQALALKQGREVVFPLFSCAVVCQEG